MQIKPYTGGSIISIILILFSPYPFFKNVIFAHEFVHEFLCEFVKEFFTNFVYEFKYEIRTNSYEFFYTKNWFCYEWPVL